jgi:RHH-type proline utilization regulon transcriptional repressor/proline dehydrogenase/delta 1-pyrroline-5-carboxylate dehydrogenase
MGVKTIIPVRICSAQAGRFAIVSSMSTDFSPYLYQDENKAVEALLEGLHWDEVLAAKTRDDAIDLITRIRRTRRKPGSLESFFQQYGLDTNEGLALMSLAEALLRIPDSAGANALIRDKVAGTNWLKNKRDNQDWLTKVAGTGLKISSQTMNSLFSKISQPLIREAMVRAMKVLGKQFVVGEDLPEAMRRAKKWEEKDFRFSYDMLGEGARTYDQAEHYFDTYRRALSQLAEQSEEYTKARRPGISIKLSALHPRFEVLQEAECVPALVEKLESLCNIAARHNFTLTVDAEEAARLKPTMDIVKVLIEGQVTREWDGFGLALQAYHKAAPEALNWITGHTRTHNRNIHLRLVKGAYWDSEIKHAQLEGHNDFPVYTRKVNTDISYLRCSQEMLRLRGPVFPRFGTHNAHTVSAILNMAGDHSGFEFQKLYGMGDALYNQVRELYPDLGLCVYAPVGPYEDLLPYLVRRMLENGANSSFVHKIHDKEYAPEEIAADPVEVVKHHDSHRHPVIRLPENLYGDARKNSEGLNFDSAEQVERLILKLKDYSHNLYSAVSLINGKQIAYGTQMETCNPATGEQIGLVTYAGSALIPQAYSAAKEGHHVWSETPADQRATVLEKIAGAMNEKREELIYLIVNEGGRTLKDADAEVREAIDFCRYYAAQGRYDFAEDGRRLTSPTGETNIYTLKSRGIFVCISPWNFPVAIFTGQIVAALMAGNAVIAKPAEQTCLSAYFLVRLMHKAGVPPQALGFLPGDGDLGAMLVEHDDLAGVAFTGSTAVAKAINMSLAEKEGPIARLIAETGGQNAMIVDSSALPEQVVDDVVHSAFGSAGQRCSACRVLYVQEEVAERTINMLKGAMQTLNIGNPAVPSTDIGPVIEEEALSNVQHHKVRLSGFAKKIAETPMDESLKQRGHFFAPLAYEIPSLQFLEREVFGPVLHVIRYKSSEIREVIDQINATGYGLTFGIHSRNEQFIDQVTSRIRAGNVYVNKGVTGAVVGVQPFGGRGLSGTGPKAGGPQYLRAFASEKLVSTNTTASGGNASLVMLGE